LSDPLLLSPGAFISKADVLSSVDHVVYATPDLDRGVEEIEKTIGVRAVFGGVHPGRGTRNALIALGPSVYLEIVAPDPDQPAPSEPRAFGIDDLVQSRLVAWAVKSGDVDSLRNEAVTKGVRLGEMRAGSRRLVDGAVLTWRFTEPGNSVAEGIVPFFINWGESPHPAATAPKDAVLVALRVEHPDERRVRQMLQILGLGISVQHGPRPMLVAFIDGPNGRIELR
jgi:hypothetical protein